MSAATDFLQYLGEDAQTNAQLQEASGLAQPTVNNRLTALKLMGLVKRTANGWVTVVKANGSEPPVNDSPIPPPKAKRETVRAKRVTKAAAPPEEDAMFSFFLDDDFDLQICRKDGQGDAAIIPRQEALRLRDFLNQVGDVMRSA